MLKDIILEICNEENIELKSYCNDYCFKLCKNNKITYIYDSIFENNNSALYKILKDKSAVFEILDKNKIPCIEHYYFHSSEKEKFKANSPILLKEHKKLVLKQNEGMSGNYVFLIDNEETLAEKSELIFNKFNSLTVSPFYDIKHEFRVVVLNDNVELVFDKIRPFVVGDGKTSIEELAKNKYKYFKIDKNIDPKFTPKNGEKITLSWRHNLNFGSVPEIVTDKNILSKLQKLSEKISNLLKIKFACIDIIETTNGELKVLEINGSVTMGKFASFSEENYKLAKQIYKKAILNNLQ